MPLDPPFRPLNPWGRPMPKLKKRPDPQALFQVWVITDDGEEYAASMKFGGPDGKEAAEQACEAANIAILKRARPEWQTAYIKKFALVPH